MNLLKKIKLNYNLKLFEEHVSNKEFDFDGNGRIINKIIKYFRLLNNIVSLL